MKTDVFVDYEYLHYSSINMFGVKMFVTDIISRVKDLGRLYIFADFNKFPDVKRNLLSLGFGSSIVDCEVRSAYKKSSTDFIMLDKIYRNEFLSSPPEQYILVTGDGDFREVINFLKYDRRRRVGVMAIKGTLSNDIKLCSDWTMYVVPESIVDLFYKEMISKINSETWPKTKKETTRFIQGTRSNLFREVAERVLFRALQNSVLERAEKWYSPL
jgi:NYN domain